ncbi:ankyrin repeat-containing domain protein [Flagelloscypha sp. PMI_526]|nr:ankyrin repeat-containing domain protein [Flagelloscypha sp. PMI_526]
MYATLLHHLAARGHTAALKCVLSGAPDVNTICSVGADTPLHRASSNGHLDSVRLLLASGADLTLRNLSQHTPAMAAILRNHAEVAIFLISNSKDSQLEDPCCNRNSTLLHAASKKGLLKVVQVLLWRDVHPNILDLDGRTPLVHACSRGHAEIIQVLLQQLHTKKLLYGSLDTPLYVAIENGHEDAVRLLLEAGAISQINSQRNKFEDLKRWAPMGKHVSKPLHLACSFGHTKIAQLLLEHGADTSIPDSSRQTQEDLVK